MVSILDEELATTYGKNETFWSNAYLAIQDDILDLTDKTLNEITEGNEDL